MSVLPHELLKADRLGLFAKVSVIAMAGAVAFGCTSDDRARLVVYSPHGKEMLSLYEHEFERLRPDVDVQWIDMGGQNAEDRIRTERGNPQASIWWGGAGMSFDRAAREGLLEAYQPSWKEAIPPEAHDPTDLWYGTFYTPEVIAYNSEALGEGDVPKSWDELLTPKWQDRVIIRYPLASSTMRTIFGAMILRQPSVDAGYRWLARLDQNVKTYAADPTQLYLKIARGEGDVTLWNLPDIFLQQDLNGYPFWYVIPEEGTPVLTDCIALVKNGPNQDIAREFYEFVTSDSALVRQSHEFYRIPVRVDIPEESLPEWMRTLNLVAMEVDWPRLVDGVPEWMRYWDENIKGRGEAYLVEG